MGRQPESLGTERPARPGERRHAAPVDLVSAGPYVAGTLAALSRPEDTEGVVSASGFCGIGSWGSWGGQRRSLAAYVGMAGVRARGDRRRRALKRDGRAGIVRCRGSRPVSSGGYIRQQNPHDHRRVPSAPIPARSRRPTAPCPRVSRVLRPVHHGIPRPPCRPPRAAPPAAKVSRVPPEGRGQGEGGGGSQRTSRLLDTGARRV